MVEETFIQAETFLPSAFQTSSTDVSAGKIDDLNYDLGNLIAFDTHPVDRSAYKKNTEKYMKELTRQNTQLLIKHVFNLPVDKSEGVPEADLPKGTTRLPRMRRVPEAKPETRWEKFAREKGIKKKEKRGRMEWDESKEEWKPRWGKDRVNDNLKDWAIEVKKGTDPYADPFEQRQLEKKQRVISNSLNRVKNLQKANKARGIKAADTIPAGIPGQLTLNEGNVSGITKKANKGKKSNKGEDISTKQSRLRAVQVSTASLGKFDKKALGEPDRPVDPQRRKRMPVESSVKLENKRNTDILRKVLKGTGEGEAAAAKQTSARQPSTKSEPEMPKVTKRQMKKQKKAASIAASAAKKGAKKGKR